LDREYRKQKRYLTQLGQQQLKMAGYKEEKEAADQKRIQAVKLYGIASAVEAKASTKNKLDFDSVTDKKKDVKAIDDELAKKAKSLEQSEKDRLNLEDTADKTIAREIEALHTKIDGARTKRLFSKTHHVCSDLLTPVVVLQGEKPKYKTAS
jgi:hypothetical protein